MDEQSRELPDALSEIEEAAQARLSSQLRMMIRALLASPQRNRLFLLGGAIFCVIVATAYGQIRLNSWNQPFYDSLARRDFPTFLNQLLVFVMIAGGLLALNVFQTWLNQMTKLKLRESLAGDLIGEWMEPRRAFRLANAGAIGVNPDQRLHEDARHLTELSTDLGIGLLQASILLVSFIGVLWSLSSGFIFHIGGYHLSIPGYMVWCAVIYAGSASWFSWRVGRPLIRLNAERYGREADLRFSLMRVNENVDAISLAGGEPDERRRLLNDLGDVLAAMRRLATALTNLTWLTAGYGWFTIVAPILVATPVYFAGNLSLGGLMMAVGAFNQVQSSLRWFVDNFSVIADWRATLLRVASFRRAMLAADVLQTGHHRIEVVENQEERLTFDEVEISSKGGATALRERQVAIEAGERVLIVGAAGVGKTLLFRVLAGLWPWGHGRIGLPRGQAITAMPRTPYIPPGRLRDVLSYPSAPETFAEPDLVAALGSVGLDRFAADLDRQARWDRELTEGEQQRLAFARLRLHKPRWVLIDEALDALDDDARQRVAAILRDDLPEAAIINIGRAEPHDRLFPRVLHLVKRSGRRYADTSSQARAAS
ncbi:ABC transporter ATP-binding protein/permease [Labrys wisconsinensis]|uniref:ATP-binding cassette transporter n=1 Tax=Labrys wisconsinensis TaxID=425677 RepID=A0ABU0JC28_9HYPH|nr:ABC transporter ATP-binding protein/permease [Labrys wisconsinensis]MDQ0470968.1 putative ATP-binding cassette transporter [Labrys wisconsinensis]